MSSSNMPPSRFRFAPAVRVVLNVAIGTCRFVIHLVALAGQGWRHISVFHRNTKLRGGPLLHRRAPTVRLGRTLLAWFGFALIAIVMLAVLGFVVVLGIGILVLLQAALAAITAGVAAGLHAAAEFVSFAAAVLICGSLTTRVIAHFRRMHEEGRMRDERRKRDERRIHDE